MNIPSPMKKTLKKREKASTASRPPYRVSLSCQSMNTDRAISPASPRTDSHARRAFRLSGVTRSTANTNRASPARANSGVSRCRFAVSSMTF